MKQSIWLAGGSLLALFFVLFMYYSAAENPEREQHSQQPRDKGEVITLATTTSTYDTGLLDVLIEAFQAFHEHQVDVRVIAVGTGQAIQLGKDGNADVLIVHARELEDQFMAEGYGEIAYDLMYNEFIVAGPAEDPANIRQASSAAEAFQRIAQAESLFISRGDESGTHYKELQIWQQSGRDIPTEKWYLSAGQGMGATMQMAGEMQAYTLVDEATYLTQPYGLQPWFKGDDLLHNRYGIILVKSSLNRYWSLQFIDFVTGPQGQAIVSHFGEDTYGKPIFIPEVHQRENE